MSDLAIRVENLSKQYKIGLKRHDRLKDLLADNLNGLFFRSRSPVPGPPSPDGPNPQSAIRNPQSDYIWALKDVSFELKQGETLGIIGANGAGKSTLLKILSRITEPTCGRAEIYGRVGSLLEVGTGFDQELTGRENIYLNGAVLGMTKSEIGRKFDDIVDFSGIEKFIDTPVKRYSSGMYVRLAFAVAAHLEPEILIVDEVLAVGDIAFQRKCLVKMGEVITEGRTVLFVSHNVGMIAELCRRTLLLEGGCLSLDGSSTDVITKYMAKTEKGVGYWTGSVPEEAYGRQAWLKHARLFSRNSDKISTLFHYDEEIKIEICYEIKSTVSVFRSYLILKDSRGNIIWASHDTDGTGLLGQVREPGVYCSMCVLPQRLLRPDQYYLTIGIYGIPRSAFEEERYDILTFEISKVDYPFNSDARIGVLTPFFAWKVERQSQNEA